MNGWYSLEYEHCGFTPISKNYSDRKNPGHKQEQTTKTGRHYPGI